MEGQNHIRHWKYNTSHERNGETPSIHLRTGSEKTKSQTEETIIYSRRADGHHSNGIVIAMSKDTTSLDKWKPVSDRIITARSCSKHIKTTIIQVYAPTNDTEEESKELFYEQLQKVVYSTPRHDLLLVRFQCKS